MATALSRQRPRDVFDLGAMLQDHAVGEQLWGTFLVYLTCSPKPAWELLEPIDPPDFDAIIVSHFNGMSTQPIRVGAQLKKRERLLACMA